MTHMSNKNSPQKYSEDFKKIIVTLYQSGKTYSELQKEYGVSSSALSNWVRKYSLVQVDDDTLLTPNVSRRSNVATLNWKRRT